MFSQEILKTLQDCIDTYGKEAQIEMCIEECSELIFALQKYKRNLKKPKSLKDTAAIMLNVEEEIADVIILTQQMLMCFDKEAIKLALEFKIARQVKRLAKYKKKIEELP
jgi:NTP pyrophosphatase (non-canonical NTP hydrolase)